MPVRSSIAVRLFWTCWLVYTLHFATNIVRDIYLGVAIGDRLSFRVDEYAGMHPDLFEHPGYGWHTGANPGVSMIGALPYAVARPAIDGIAERVNSARRAAAADPPEYASPWPLAREMYRQAWQRGLDVKLGLAAFVMQAGAMAPLSAAAVALMFLFLERLLSSARAALVLALLYGFATPVFFRTGTLNHNILAAHFGFAAFCLVAPLWRGNVWPAARRELLAGFLAGLCVLLDYTGALLAGPLGLLALWQARQEGRPMLPTAARFGAGAAGPILLLWWYQWRSFGHPFYPGQRWMPQLDWIEERGFRGVTLPQWRWAWRLWLDPAYGLLPSCPLLALALWPTPALQALGRTRTAFLYASAGALWLFVSGVDYNAIQDNTGIRYMAPAFPLLFVPAALTLVRLPRAVAAAFAGASLLVNWCLAMFRDVERGRGVLDPILDLLREGPALPALTTVSLIPGRWAEAADSTWTVIGVYLVAAIGLWGIWRQREAAARRARNEG
jgi:hypothetical protein